MGEMPMPGSWGGAVSAHASSRARMKLQLRRWNARWWLQSPWRPNSITTLLWRWKSA